MKGYTLDIEWLAILFTVITFTQINMDAIIYRTGKSSIRKNIGHLISN
jgi:hypothetical protein